MDIIWVSKRLAAGDFVVEKPTKTIWSQSTYEIHINLQINLGKTS